MEEKDRVEHHHHHHHHSTSEHSSMTHQSTSGAQEHHHHSEGHHEHHHTEYVDDYEEYDPYAPEHRHHRHRHHYDPSLNMDDSLMGNLRQLNKAKKDEQGIKLKDVTSRFRNAMQQRYLRKRLMQHILWYFLIAVAVVVVCAFFYAYCIDIQEAEIQY